jgi:hypothetical protein
VCSVCCVCSRDGTCRSTLEILMLEDDVGTDLLASDLSLHHAVAGYPTSFSKMPSRRSFDIS